DPPQGREPPGDGVGARGEPLVGQGLPGGQLDEVRRAHQGGQRRAQVLGGPGGGGDDDQRRLGGGPTGEGRHQAGEQAGGGDDAAALTAAGPLLDQFADRGEVAAGGQLVEQRAQRRAGRGRGGSGGLRGHRASREWKRCWAAVSPSRMTDSTASAASGTSVSSDRRSVVLKGASTWSAVSRPPVGRPTPTRTRR